MVIEAVHLDEHGTTRLDQRGGAGPGLEDVLMSGSGGVAVLFVGVDVDGAATGLGQGVVRVGVVVRVIRRTQSVRQVP